MPIQRPRVAPTIFRNRFSLGERVFGKSSVLRSNARIPRGPPPCAATVSLAILPELLLTASVGVGRLDGTGFFDRAGARPQSRLRRPASRSDGATVAVGFQPTVEKTPRAVARRVATPMIADRGRRRRNARFIASLRDARACRGIAFRGLKPTATLMASLRDPEPTRTPSVPAHHPPRDPKPPIPNPQPPIPNPRPLSP